MSRAAKKERIATSPEHQRMIRNRVGLILFCLLLIISLIVFNYYQQESTDWNSIDFNLNIFLLINLNILLLVIVIFLVIRNLIKLVYERRRRKLGFRLKFKLTTAFILVSSLPMVMFFFIANGLLKDNLDFWFKGQFALALHDSANVVERLSQYQSEDLKHFVSVVATDYLEQIGTYPLSKDQNVDIKQWMDTELSRYRLDGLVWYNERLQPILSTFKDEDKQIAWIALDQSKGIDQSSDFPLEIHDKTSTGHINRGIVVVVLQDQYFYLEASKILTGSKYEDLAVMQSNLKNFRNLSHLQSPIRTNFTTYLLLFTVLIIFGGVWFGYYLAAGIVSPIETLVKGTERIAEGDLDFQIELQVDDEIGKLLDSFNAMTLELLQNRKKLAVSREALIDTNKAIEERNIFVELLLQNIHTGILSVDNSGYINSINPYMIRLFQIKPSDVIQKHYLSVLTKEQQEQFEALNNELATSRQTSVTKNTHLKFDKRTIHMSMELFQLKNPKGDQLGRLLVVDDLTEIDRSTRASAWREVARRIAHEIKNPLTPIQLSTQRIRRKYMGQVEEPEMLDNCTSTIIEEVNGLKKMVNEFSKFARLPEINPAPDNINRILESVVDFFKEGLPPLVQINLKTDPSIPETLLDEEQIKRVFTNLIDNAVGAISGSGEIDLVSLYSEELKMVIVQVIDDGCGVPARIVSRIFDPYVTTKKEGTGLGLAIVQQIISDHGGFIRLSNNEGEGTTVTIELPA